MRVHFIAIGGSIMHNMAIAMKKNGHEVSGSDDIIYDPARSRLAAQDLLPSETGWDPGRIDSDIDLVILGMHAHADNPEMRKARELGLVIQSFPEYLGEHGKDKTTVAICGSHGKTTTTSMVMHILREQGLDFDYAVGAGLEGFDDMVRLSDAPLIIIEGDEYLSSALDPRPKFLHYDPDIAVLTGIAWDHVNVFPSYEEYLEAFRSLVEMMDEEDTLIYNPNDQEVRDLALKGNFRSRMIPFPQIRHSRNGETFSFTVGDQIRGLRLFGAYNVHNLMAAWQVCRELGLKDKDILKSVASFQLPDKRMNVLVDRSDLKIYRDYAHAPSKVKASIKAFCELSDGSNTMAVLEIHTYSSLNKNFLPQYSGVFESVDIPVLFYNPDNLKIKRLPAMSDDYIRKAFDEPRLRIVKDIDALKFMVQEEIGALDHILLMSSSNFGGMDWKEAAEASD